MANGTDALLLALRALDVGPGDEVIVPSFTFFASAEPVALLGATPVWCDVDPSTFLSTADHVREVVTPKTKAVIAVHLFGNVAPIEEIAALGFPVIEDAAQSAGTRLADGRRPGALGTIATFSFFPSKNLGAFGDGGAVTTDDDALADRIEHYRFHGSKDKRTFVYVGHNSRLDALQAGILRVQLPHLDAWADGRRAARGPMRRPASASSSRCRSRRRAPSPPGTSTSSAPNAPTSCSRRSRTPASAPRPTTASPTTSSPRCATSRRRSSCPGTEEAARTNLAIPMSPVLTPRAGRRGRGGRRGSTRRRLTNRSL